jgi:hypothetical protein
LDSKKKEGKFGISLSCMEFSLHMEFEKKLYFFSILYIYIFCNLNILIVFFITPKSLYHVILHVLHHFLRLKKENLVMNHLIFFLKLWEWGPSIFVCKNCLICSSNLQVLNYACKIGKIKRYSMITRKSNSTYLQYLSLAHHTKRLYL